MIRDLFYYVDNKFWMGISFSFEGVRLGGMFV